MAFKIPGVAESLSGVPELWDANLHRPYIDGVVVTSTAADLNLSAGLVAGAITTGAVKYFDKEVTCAQGTAVVTAICTIPIGSIILDIFTYCTEAFDGATTKTFEVGVSGNTDKYIDPLDCPVTLAGVMDIFIGTNQDQKTAESLSAAVIIQSVHTNTTTATAGKIRGRVIYC